MAPRVPIRRLVLIALGVTAMMSAAVGEAVATTVTVCPSGCAFSQIAPALAAARSGDTIAVAAGTYSGGFTIDISVNLVGAGAGATVIRGGGPVVTIGVGGAPSEPTVSISGVTITGGDNRSSPFPFVALGGGINIPNSARGGPGATVSISSSVISGNRVGPSVAIASQFLCPPDITITCINGHLPFAIARGGGIATGGALTLSNTVISDNIAGSNVASDAEGGAIVGGVGSSITLRNSTVSGNEANAVAPNGRFADSGGIFAFGKLSIANSVIRDNSATLAASMPSDVPTGAQAVAGGIHVADTGSATISNTTIADNSLAMTNTVGDAIAFSGGLHTDVSFTLSNDVIADNHVSAVTLPGSSGNASADSGAGEMGGTVSNTRLTGNSVTVVSAAGDAVASAGAAIYAGSMTNSVVSGNELHATSPHGTVIVAGAGLVAGDALTLRNTSLSRNTGNAEGSNGFALGGGILDVDQSPNGPPGGPLVLSNSSVTGNELSGGSGITVLGGGLFITRPLTLVNSTISGNIPDNCSGSGC